jgi:hypothetical protein
MSDAADDEGENLGSVVNCPCSAVEVEGFFRFLKQNNILSIWRIELNRRSFFLFSKSNDHVATPTATKRENENNPVTSPLRCPTNRKSHGIFFWIPIFLACPHPHPHQDELPSTIIIIMNYYHHYQYSPPRSSFPTLYGGGFRSPPPTYPPRLRTVRSNGTR